MKRTHARRTVAHAALWSRRCCRAQQSQERYGQAFLNIRVLDDLAELGEGELAVFVHVRLVERLLHDLRQLVVRDVIAGHDLDDLGHFLRVNKPVVLDVVDLEDDCGAA